MFSGGLSALMFNGSPKACLARRRGINHDDENRLDARLRHRSGDAIRG
jgi:hypothetical protein